MDERDQPIQPHHSVAGHGPTGKSAITSDIIAHLHQRGIATASGNRCIDIGIEPAGEHIDPQVNARRAHQRDGVGQPVGDRHIGIEVRSGFERQFYTCLRRPFSAGRDAFGKAFGGFRPGEVCASTTGECDALCADGMGKVDRLPQPVARRQQVCCFGKGKRPMCQRGDCQLAVAEKARGFVHAITGDVIQRRADRGNPQTHDALHLNVQRGRGHAKCVDRNLWSGCHGSTLQTKRTRCNPLIGPKATNGESAP